MSGLRPRPAKGGASIYASGIEPGFLCDHLPIVLVDRQRGRSARSTATRSRSTTTTASKEIMIDALGFGRPLDFEPWIMLPGGIAGEFEGQIRYIADGLGVEVDEVRETYDRRLTDQPIETAFGTVEPGHLPARSASRRSASSTGARRSSSTTSPAWPATSAPTGRSARPTSPTASCSKASPTSTAGSLRRWTTPPRPASRRWAAAPARCSPPRCASSTPCRTWSTPSPGCCARWRCRSPCPGNAFRA